MDQAQNLRDMMKNTPKQEIGEKKSRIIAITSGKGGVGKTSTSINLAIQFRKQGKSVIIFDADFGLANIEVMFGAIPKYNLSDLVYRGKDLKDIIVKGPMDIGFISGGSGISGFADITKDQIMYLIYKLKELENMADVIIIDTGAGISSAVMDFLVISDEIILVMTPEPTSITDSYALLKALNRHENFDNENTTVRVVANRVSSQEEGNNLYAKIQVVVDKFLNIHTDLLGTIETDDNMSKSIIQQKPISMAYPNSRAARSYEKLGCKLMDMEESANPGKEKGFALMFARMFKRNKGGV